MLLLPFWEKGGIEWKGIREKERKGGGEKRKGKE